MITESQDRVFSATNFHSADCGQPPSVRDDGTSPNYCGYFVNRHGEQWVVTIDPEVNTGILRGGDIGWDTEVQIADGKITGDVILGDDERRWLDACWRAGCGEPLKG